MLKGFIKGYMKAYKFYTLQGIIFPPYNDYEFIYYLKCLSKMNH